MSRISVPQPDRSTRATSSAAFLIRALSVAAGFLVLLAPCFALQVSPPPTPQIVVIKQMHFEPSTLNVKPGDTVEWKNEDIFTHTVTASDGSFDSGPIAPGSTWQTTINKAGTISYHCRPHPNMTAMLVVQGAQAETQDQEEGQLSLRWSLPRSPDEIHPILVNFTAALLPLALLSDLLGRWLRRPGLHAAGFWMMVYEAAITPLTVIAGWWWKNSEGHELPARLIAVHQWLGTAAAFLIVALVIWRWSFHKRALPPSWPYLTAALLLVVALIYQGSLGGAMVFGH